MRFEWDPAKERANLRKHGLSFGAVLRVFVDPFALSARDRDEHGEERWRTIGSSDGGVLVFVAHTIREEVDGGEVMRIISARRATRVERRRYEEERRGEG